MDKANTVYRRHIAIPPQRRPASISKPTAPNSRPTPPTPFSTQTPTTISASNGTTTAPPPPPFEDTFIATTTAAFYSDSDGGSGAGPESLGPLQRLQQESLARLRSMRMPTTRQEEYRYTDVSPIVQSSIVLPQEANGQLVSETIALSQFQEAECEIVVLNGQVAMNRSTTKNLPSGAFLGPLNQAPAEVQEKLGSSMPANPATFPTLNSALCTSPLVLYLPPNSSLPQPLHVLYLTSGIPQDEGKVAASSPRLLVVAGEGSSAEVVEEFTHVGESGQYFCNHVTEVVVGEGARVKHGYIQGNHPDSFHLSATYVTQARTSTYSIVEVNYGAKIARHDLQITQQGEATETSMKHFVMCGTNQLHDLHTRLLLEHPKGWANQLHKCIAMTPTSRGVFDGNVQVAQAAQQTDAGQLSRNLVLVPRATVNVKPNLQIIADDVTCTHGCTVSDLSDEELFYFRARGIDIVEARKALVVSFGADIIQELGHKSLTSRVQDAVNSLSSATYLS